MIWVKCIFGLLLLKVITCSTEISHGKNIRIPRQIPGGLVDKDPNDPKYLYLARLALNYYDSGSQYSAVQVTRATEQVVAGNLIRIDFYAVPTSSSCQCQNINPYNLLSCHAEFSEQSWLNNYNVNSVNCN